MKIVVFLLFFCGIKGLIKRRHFQKQLKSVFRLSPKVFLKALFFGFRLGGETYLGCFHSCIHGHTNIMKFGRSEMVSIDNRLIFRSTFQLPPGTGSVDRNRLTFRLPPGAGSVDRNRLTFRLPTGTGSVVSRYQTTRKTALQCITDINPNSLYLH